MSNKHPDGEQAEISVGCRSLGNHAQDGSQLPDTLTSVPKEDRIMLLVKPPNSPMICVSMSRKGSIHDLKQLIEEESAISAAHQVLVWNGKVLTNNNVLRDYEIDNLDTSH